VAIAGVYGSVLGFLDLPPELQPSERDAIVSSLDACAQRYGGGFNHWPLVALASSLTAPVILRLKLAAESEDTPPVRAPQTHQPTPKPAERRSPLAQGKRSTAAELAGVG